TDIRLDRSSRAAPARATPGGSARLERGTHESASDAGFRGRDALSFRRCGPRGTATGPLVASSAHPGDQRGRVFARWAHPGDGERRLHRSVVERTGRRAAGDGRGPLRAGDVPGLLARWGAAG